MSQHVVNGSECQPEFDQNLNPLPVPGEITANPLTVSGDTAYSLVVPGDITGNARPVPGDITANPHPIPGDITAYFSNQETPFDLIAGARALKLDDNNDAPVDAPVDAPAYPFSGISAPGSDPMAMSAISALEGQATTLSLASPEAFIDNDDLSHAWIPGEATRRYLDALTTSSDPAELPEEDRVTTLRVLMVENLVDPVLDLVGRLFGAEGIHERKSLTVSDVPTSLDGLRSLIASGDHRSAVDLTRRLLESASAGQPDGQSDADGDLGSVTPVTPTTLQLWTTRLTLMFKLHLYPAVEAELSAFEDLDQPDLYFRFYPTGDFPASARGSMVPFALRVLWAELPAHLGKPKDTLDRLYGLISVIDAMIENINSGVSADGFCEPPSSPEAVTAALATWRRRRSTLLHSIANIFVAIKEVDSAIAIWERIAEEEEDKKRKSVIYFSVGRVLLQVGDVISAEEYFVAAEENAFEADGESIDLEATKLAHRGYLALGRGNFNEAFAHLKEALALKPGDAVIASNAACCLLYLARLGEAVSILMSLVSSDPSRLHEDFCHNLVTLFELESTMGGNRKKELLKLVAQHKGNGFNPHCLKIS